MPGPIDNHTNVLYEGHIYRLAETTEFARWFGSLRDVRAVAKIADRLKRMINASGYKVWPAEVEAKLYKHPAIQECCIIASPDERRGETVKAVVVLKPGASASGDEILDWARGQMATYKAPKRIEFSAALPRTGSGKIQWRTLQEKEFSR